VNYVILACGGCEGPAPPASSITSISDATTIPAFVRPGVRAADPDRAIRGRELSDLLARIPRGGAAQILLPPTAPVQGRDEAAGVRAADYYAYVHAVAPAR
jgi:hypothetical protein